MGCKKRPKKLTYEDTLLAVAAWYTESKGRAIEPHELMALIASSGYSAKTLEVAEFIAIGIRDNAIERNGLGYVPSRQFLGHIVSLTQGKTDA